MSNTIPNAYIKTMMEQGSQVFPRTKYAAVYSNDGQENLNDRLEDIDKELGDLHALNGNVASLGGAIDALSMAMGKMHTIASVQTEESDSGVEVTITYNGIDTDGDGDIDSTPTSLKFFIPSGKDFTITGVVPTFEALSSIANKNAGDLFAVQEATDGHPAGLYYYNYLGQWDYIGAAGTGIKEVQLLNDYVQTSDESPDSTKSYFILNAETNEYELATISGNAFSEGVVYYEAPSYSLKIIYDNDDFDITESVRGRGIKNISFNTNSELIIEYTDSPHTENLGKIGLTGIKIEGGILKVQLPGDNSESYRDLGRVLGTGIKNITVLNNYFETLDTSYDDSKSYFILNEETDEYELATISGTFEEGVVYYEAPTYGLRIEYDDDTTVQHTASVKGRDIASAEIIEGKLKVTYSDGTSDDNVGTLYYPLNLNNSNLSHEIQDLGESDMVSSGVLYINQLDSNKDVVGNVALTLNSGLQAYFNYVYELTTDTIPEEGKEYYKLNNTVYELVENPATEEGFPSNIYEKRAEAHVANAVTRTEEGFSLAPPAPGAIASYALGEEAEENLITSVWRPVYIKPYSKDENYNYSLVINDPPTIVPDEPDAAAAEENSLFTINYMNVSGEYVAVPEDAEFDDNKTYYVQVANGVYSQVTISEFAPGVTYYTYVTGAATHASTLLRSTITYQADPVTAASYPTLTMKLKGRMEYETGADYAEYFEWADGNAMAADRRGLFVAFDENNYEQIRLANSSDEVMGIVSVQPGAVGNAAEFEWAHKYVRDAFGVVTTDENGAPVLNPVYDASKVYVPRSQRKEWTMIGLMGQLVVCDDGTCEVGKYCACGSKGIATAATTGWRVMKRIDKNHIKILFK